MYSMRKLLNPDKGYPTCFRQHYAESHCRFLHGYDLRFEVEVACREYDRTAEGWVFNFGEFKGLKSFLDEMFDHTCLVSQSDPLLEYYKELHDLGLIQVRVVQDTGCEAFAKMVFDYMADYLKKHHPTRKTLAVKSVTCYENGSNSATYAGPFSA